MNNTIAIYSSKKSEQIVKFCTGVYELLAYCSMRQAKTIQKAANNNLLHGCYFDKNGNVRATYK